MTRAGRSCSRTARSAGSCSPNRARTTAVGYALTPTSVAVRVAPGDRPDRRGRRRCLPALTRVRRAWHGCARVPHRLRGGSTRHAADSMAPHGADDVFGCPRRAHGRVLGDLSRGESAQRDRDRRPAVRRPAGRRTRPPGTAATIARFDGPARPRGRAMDPARHGTADRTTLSALRGSLAADIAELRDRPARLERQPARGRTGRLPDDPRLPAPRDARGRRADGRRAGARWPRYTDRQLATLRASLADGRVASVSPVRRTIAVLEELLDAPVDEWPLLDPLSTLEELDGWSGDERTAFAACAPRGRSSDDDPPGVHPRSTTPSCVEVLPAARPDGEPGMCAVARRRRGLSPPDPDAHVARRRRRDAPPDRARRGRPDRRARWWSSAGRTLGVGDAGRLALSALRADPTLFFGSRRGGVRHGGREPRAGRARSAPAWFGRLPAAACVILEMPSHEEDHVGAAYYRPLGEDGSRPGQYVVNTSQPARPAALRGRGARLSRGGARATTSRARSGRSSTGCPTFRRHLGPTAYFEGWGLYAERLADEMGLYTGDLDRIGMLSFDAWRAARLVVDTGIHAMGWSRQQAIDFMLGHTALAPRRRRRRGRPLHRAAGPGARLQDRPAGAAAHPRGGAAAARARPSTSAGSTTRSCRTARCRCRRSPRSCTPGPTRLRRRRSRCPSPRGSPRPADRHRRRLAPRAAARNSDPTR